MKAQHLSRLMHLSWDIQRRKKSSRSKALTAAWVIYLNEEITVYYLIKKHSHDKYPNRIQPSEITLFHQ